jgi:hypothetical protein
MIHAERAAFPSGRNGALRLSYRAGPVFTHSRKINVEDPAFVEDPVPPGVPDPPYNPDSPRSFPDLARRMG